MLSEQSFITKILKNAYYKHLRLKNKNKKPTIISSNCIGSQIYRDLGLKYYSPTIDLMFGSFTEYVTFCKDIKYYSNCPIADASNDEKYKKDYPVGLLVGDSEHPTISVHFFHYHSFENAVEKWKRRAKRMDYNNIFYFIDYPSYATELEALTEFDNLPVNKMCILHKDIPSIRNKTVVNIDNDGPGRIFFPQAKRPWKRYLEQVDYVSFLNNDSSWKDKL